MSDPTLLAQPVIRLLRKIRDTQVAKELWSCSLRGRFVSNVLGAVLAKLSVGSFTVWFGPRATWAINTAFLIQSGKRPQRSSCAHLTNGAF
jgi:hypothetical protein